MVNQQQFSNMGNFMPNRNQFSSYFNNPSSVGVSTQINNIVWVQGIEGAKAYQLNPNSMMILLDSETEGKMYIKVSDNIGMSNLRTFNYVEEFSTQNATVNQDLDLSAFVRKDELSNLIKEILTNEQSIQATTGNDISAPVSVPAKPKVTIIGTTNKQS